MLIKKAWTEQPGIFATGLIFFVMIAVFGWEKLPYGFNFLDEGWHMTESWRLAAGDDFLRDKLTGGNMLYTVINSLVFRISPDITLLGFRKLQYVLTICSLLLFGISLFKTDKQYWYMPFIFSLFAFTGLDPIGWTSNLNYFTYPHLFVTLYLSFLIFGLYSENTILKRLMYVVSGLFLWGISLTLLHLSAIVLSPVLLFLISQKLRLKSFSFKFADLCFVLAPFVFCWTVFVVIYNKPYILSIFRSARLTLSVVGHTPGFLIHINLEAIKHIGISILFLLLCIVCSKKGRYPSFIVCLAIMSLLMLFVIDTSFFGLIAPYRRFFERPMWFSSLLISFFIIFLFHVIRKHYSINRKYNKGEELAIILFIPCGILSLSNSIFSSNGVLTVLYSSIPATAAITSMILYRESIRMRPYFVKLLVLVIFFLPFYYTIAWSDWKSTCWDVFPEQANATIKEGFGKGIKTNPIYRSLYRWIRMCTENYTEKGDFMISYGSPMVYMISKLRPSLDDTFVPYISLDYYKKSFELMKKRERYPKIAFLFERIPALYPISLKENKYTWLAKDFAFPLDNPIARYVTKNMTLVNEFKIYKGNTVRCYVDRKINSEKALGNRHAPL